MRRHLALGSAVLAGLLVGALLGIRLMGPHATVPQPWTANLSGTPSSPQPFCSAEFDCESQNQDATATLPLMQAQHGSDCSAYPNTHPVSAYDDTIFLCNNHVMTAIASTTCCPVVKEGYAEVSLTPSYLVDISGGTAQVSYHVSTNRTAARDWYEIFFTPFAENLVSPLNTGNGNAIQGPPKDGFEIMIASGVNHGSNFNFKQYVNYAPTNITGDFFTTIESKVGGYDSSIRTPFEVDFSSTHFKFGIPACPAGTLGCVGTTMGQPCPTGGCPAFWWSDANFPTALSSTQYVFQITHHDYDPFKGNGGPCVPSGEEQCLPDTWHWSDISIGSAVPFTLDKGSPANIGPFTRPQSCQGDACYTFTTVNFGTPTPTNGFLRFAMIGQAWYSLDGGATYTPVVRQLQSLNNNNTYATFWTPLPSGYSSIKLKVTTPAQFPGIAGMVRDITVWALQ